MTDIYVFHHHHVHNCIEAVKQHTPPKLNHTFTTASQNQWKNIKIKPKKEEKLSISIPFFTLYPDCFRNGVIFDSISSYLGANQHKESH